MVSSSWAAGACAVCVRDGRCLLLCGPKLRDTSKVRDVVLAVDIRAHRSSCCATCSSVRGNRRGKCVTV